MTQIIGQGGQPPKQNAISGEQVLAELMNTMFSSIMIQAFVHTFNPDQAIEVIDQVYIKAFNVWEQRWRQILQGDIAGMAELKKQAAIMFAGFKQSILDEYSVDSPAVAAECSPIIEKDEAELDVIYGDCGAKIIQFPNNKNTTEKKNET